MLATKHMIKMINDGRRFSIFDTVYVVEFDERDEFLEWCSDRDVKLEFQGPLYDRCVYRVVKDPHPEFTALRWA